MATDNLVIGAWALWNPGIPAATSQPASTEPAPRPKPSLTTLRIGKLKICHVGGAQQHVKPRRRGHQGPQPFCLALMADFHKSAASTARQRVPQR
ncbi:hypothetical protein E5D57_011844 [Metarhizium anisopliae]|nr:hypothetical protein E5D57_011844 [Metarhizium anisopliae]